MLKYDELFYKEKKIYVCIQYTILNMMFKTYIYTNNTFFLLSKLLKLLANIQLKLVVHFFFFILHYSFCTVNANLQFVKGF